MSGMSDDSIQALCELGQTQLMEMQYLAAINTLATAERLAWKLDDFNTMSRLYYPLQEARRQKRQRCGEGVVQLNLLAGGKDDPHVDADRIVRDIDHGQLLVAGWGSVEPAVVVRKRAVERNLYLECFLAAVYPIVGGERAIVVAPLADTPLPDPTERSIDALLALVPSYCIVWPKAVLPNGPMTGNTETFAHTMAVWESLHAMFLATADSTPDPIRKMQAYRQTIEVDEACELAHQNLAATARELDRARRH
jgi:hypothetical protein